MPCKRSTTYDSQMPFIVRVPTANPTAMAPRIRDFLATSGDAKGSYRLFRATDAITVHFDDCHTAVYFKLRFG